jgi:glycine cleavage system H lipoate-binding protein/ABC-type phosphate transport system substrate-binding protein
MKTFLPVFIFLSIFSFTKTGYCNPGIDNVAGEQGAVTEIKQLQIYTSPELTDLTNHWVSEYGKINPGEDINVTKTSGKAQLDNEALYFVSGHKKNELKGESAFELIVGHDIIVPVVNSKNPYLDKLSERGFTSEDFALLLKGEQNWSAFSEIETKLMVRSYIADKQEVISKIAGFAGIEVSALNAIKVSSANELISLVQKDNLAVGFCRLIDVIKTDENSFASQISILPIDKNKNGKIDGFENIFTNPAELTRGAWIGKYPRELCGDIYVLSANQPTSKAALFFLTWIINDGQEYLGDIGYSNLSSREKASGILALSSPVTSPGQVGSVGPGFPFGVFLLIAAGIIFLVVLLLRFRKKQKTAIDSEDIEITLALNVNTVAAPAGLFYDKTHTWAFMEKDGLVKIGIDDFLQHLTGQLTQVKMKAPGEKVRKGEKIFTIAHEGKQLEIYSPVSGYIKQHNQTLLSKPGMMNSAPYSEGWVYQIEPANWLRETRFMFMADKFREWLDDEFTRLKDFLATSANSNSVVYEHIVLQDGGELTDNVLAGLGPEVWEDFQTQFLDTSK